MDTLDNKITKIIDAAKMYYQLDYSQQEIAKRLGISRPSVSRLLQQAKQQGIVQIKILDPTENVQEMAEILRRKFNLKHCMIASIPVYDDQLIKEKLGEAAAEYLHQIVQDGDIIGSSWGTTLYHVAQRMQPKNVRNVTVVQLNGGVSHSDTNTYASEILNDFSKAFNTVPYFLPLPAVVDQAIVKEAMMADRHIKKVLELGKKANIAIYTVGEPTAQSTLVQADYFSAEDLKLLHEKKAVGDIVSRYFDANGVICSPELNARTIGIELQDLALKKVGILVAGGVNRVDGIYGALKGKYANTLITDQFTAKALIDLEV